MMSAVFLLGFLLTVVMIIVSLRIVLFTVFVDMHSKNILHGSI